MQGDCCSGLYCVPDAYGGGQVATDWVCASVPGLPNITLVQPTWDTTFGTAPSLNFTYTESDNGAATVCE